MSEDTTMEAPNAEAADNITEIQEAAEPVAPKEDPLLQALWKDLGRVEGDEGDISPAPENESTSVTNSQTSSEEWAAQDGSLRDELPVPPIKDEEEGAQAEVEKSKFSIRHQSMITEDTVKDAVREAVAEAVPQQTESVTEPVPNEPDPEEGLLDEQREELELARIAEKQYPDKYKGLPDRMLSYYSKHQEFAKNALEEEPEREFDEHDDEYNDWVQRNRPKFSDKDRKRVERVLVENRAYERAKEEVSSKYTELERRQKALELKPQIESRIASFEASILESSQHEAAKSIAKSGYESAKEEFPLESSVYSDTISNAKGLASEYLGFVHGLKEFDYNDPKHKWLLEFINHNGEWFEKNGGTARTRSGKSFVNRAKYAELHAAGKANSHWTWDHDDILDLLGANALHEADHHIKSTMDTAQKYGFVRPERNNSAEGEKTQASYEQQPEDIQPVNPPKATPSVGPGNADPDTSIAPEQIGGSLLSTLGMK